MVMGEIRSGGKGADDLAADEAVGVEGRSVKRLFRSPPVRAGCLHAAPRLSAAPQPHPRPQTLPHHVALDHTTSPSRTKWTRRVLHPVLIGHAASITSY
jgi:hypothetical protein